MFRQFFGLGRRAGKKQGTKPAAVAASAQRPTFEASPALQTAFHLQMMRSRLNRKSRNLSEMYRQIRDSNPDVAKAIDNYTTLCNPGYSLDVYFAREGADGPIPDPEGLAMVQSFAARMFSEYTGAYDEIGGARSTFPGLDAFIAMTHLTTATFGAMAAEIALTESLDDIEDIYPVDPVLIEFRPDPNSLKLVPGIAAFGPFTMLDPIRFRYVPYSPDVGAPAGRSPLQAALDVVFFQQEFMRELKAIAHFSNVPRLDITIVKQTIADTLQALRPDLLQPGKEADRQAYLDGVLGDVKAVIQGLAADDAFIHWDDVTANYISPSGTAIPVADILAAVDKAMISATKQLPMLLGRNEGATTTHATVQWQVYIQQLKEYQRVSKALVHWVLNLYLRIRGRQSYVIFEYAPHKTSDALVDAQADQIKTATWSTWVDRGWVDADEAAQALTGHPAVGVEITPAPTIPPAPSDPTPGGRGQRTIAAQVSELPAWLQKQHYDTLVSYRAWRSQAIVAKFRSLGMVSDMYETLKLTDGDALRLADQLRGANTRSVEAGIQEQLHVLKQPRRARLQDTRLSSNVALLALQSAESVIDTYNADLRAVIDQLMAETRAGTSHDMVSVIIRWEGERNAWKEAQVAFIEAQSSVVTGIKEFYDRNDVEGEAEVWPYGVAEDDDCYTYVSANPYPSMRVLFEKCYLPNHPNCPHYGKLTDGGSIKGEVWTG